MALAGVCLCTVEPLRVIAPSSQPTVFPTSRSPAVARLHYEPTCTQPSALHLTSHPEASSKPSCYFAINRLQLRRRIKLPCGDVSKTAIARWDVRWSTRLRLPSRRSGAHFEAWDNPPEGEPVALYYSSQTELHLQLHRRHTLKGLFVGNMATHLSAATAC